MDGNNDDNNNDDENHQDDEEENDIDGEDEEIDSDDESTVAADTMLVRASRRAKLLSLLDQYNACPFRTRNNIDDLVAEVLEKAEDDAHEMLCDQNVDNYRGLDINRDTIKEVETIVGMFPNLLSKRKETRWGEDEEGVVGWIDAEEGEGIYPIQCVLELCGPTGYSFNFKAAPFVATLAQAATQLNQFEEKERGGLLIEDENYDNTLQDLVLWPYSGNEEEHNRRIDTACLSQFIQLQQMDLFKLEDIPRYELVHRVCYQHYFAEHTFQFLVEWSPTSLVQTNEYGCLPLHCAAQESTIEGFRIVFQYVFRYYPNKKGITILFTKKNSGKTPFQIACEKHGRDGVMRIVEDTLNTSVIPLNIVEAVVLAAIDGNIHLDCVYFLLRREPDVLVRLLSAPHNNNNNIDDDDDDDDGGGGEDDHNNDGDTVNDKNEKDKDDDNDGDHVDNDNHDGDSDDDDDNDDKDEGGEKEVGIEDSTNNGTGTRKRKRKGGSIDDGG